MIFITFYGEQKSKVEHKPGNLIKIPLIVLALLSLLGGFIELPETLGNFPLFSDFLNNSLPAVNLFHEGITAELIFQVVAAVVALSGIYLAYLLYLKNPDRLKGFRESSLYDFWLKGWGFDWFYDKVFVIPVVWLSRINKNDFIDKIYTAIAWFTGLGNHLLVITQTGKLRWYAAGIVLGAIITITLSVFL
jgi:NADH-quinone oxidoreductase subunit L